MPDDNVIKFTPGPRKRPAPQKPAPQKPQRPQGQPSLPVAIVVGVIAVATMAAISWWFGR